MKNVIKLATLAAALTLTSAAFADPHKNESGHPHYAGHHPVHYDGGRHADRHRAGRKAPKRWRQREHGHHRHYRELRRDGRVREPRAYRYYYRPGTRVYLDLWL